LRQRNIALLLLFFFAKIEQFYVLSYHLMFVVLQKEIKGTANLPQNPVAHMRIDLSVLTLYVTLGQFPRVLRKMMPHK